MPTSKSPNSTTFSSCSDRDADFHRQFGTPDASTPAHSEELNSWAEIGWIASPFSDISNISMFRKPVWLAINRLYLASKLAADCGCERSEFSVNQNELAQVGLRREELKWLLIKNVVKKTESVLDPQERDSYPANRTQFAADSMFVITNLGIELVEQCLTAAKVLRSESNCGKREQALEQLQPSWDCERHELRCGGKVVKKFKWRASNQETILSAFEEEGWPAHIDDPLPQVANIAPRRRLADAIKSLNRHQKFPLVRFCGDGTGQGVLWELK